MRLFYVLLLLCALALVPLIVSTLHAQTTTAPATPTTATANVSSRTITDNDREVGEVLVGDTVVFRLREPAGGLTAGQRANIVATRMSQLMAQGYGWQDVTVGRQQNQVVLLMGNQLLVTADTAHARLNGTTPLALAYEWQGRTQTALRDVTTVATGTTSTTTTGGVVTTAVAGTQEEWPDWTDSSTKIVPIVSAGSPGVRFGLAQVTGPRNRVDEVDAVLQLDLVFQRAARVRVFIPSRSLTSINRVQGTAVSAVLQYRLVSF